MGKGSSLPNEENISSNLGIIKTSKNQVMVTAIERNVKPEGLGLKRMREDIWEIRAGLRTRILFALFPGEIRFVLIGDHNGVKDFLKRN